MGFLGNVAALSRFQFAMTVAFHFLFVPMSIGLGLILALTSRRYYKSRDPQDLAHLKLFVKIFAATFIVGVATGVTMEFAFGANWANYSRFVGDIFGAPLAAEALFAFFLESVFLGVLVFGQKRVSPKFYHASAWLVWAGSCLSALWIIIANSWMQTPAGFKIVGTGLASRAHITNFLAAAINHSTFQRYFHVVVALLAMGAFLAMAIAAYYYLKKKNLDFAKKTMRLGVVVGLIASLLMLPLGHLSAVQVADTQPEKLAAFEGHWNTGPMDMGILGWVDPANQQTHSVNVPVKGFIGLLTNLDTSTSFKGLSEIPAQDRPPLQATYQTYHFMVVLWGLMVVLAIAAFIMDRKDRIKDKKWAQKILIWAPLVPLAAIQCGWMAAEIGRQPWIVWKLQRTADAISPSVPASQIVITIALFIVVYLLIAIIYLRVVLGLIKKGPQPELAPAGAGPAEPAAAIADGSDGSDPEDGAGDGAGAAKEAN
ncbi:MAG: cytochrome ubiquinol oxidase subunit I [Coriobacteriia bacterium]|nr:cytochrome ubiquinol oxidase subunit I [Coriobacteriia bacterium]